jgi:hypothetical protein
MGMNPNLNQQQMTPDQIAIFQEQQRQVQELIKTFNIADPLKPKEILGENTINRISIRGTKKSCSNLGKSAIY